MYFSPSLFPEDKDFVDLVDACSPESRTVPSTEQVLSDFRISERTDKQMKGKRILTHLSLGNLQQNSPNALFSMMSFVTEFSHLLMISALLPFSLNTQIDYVPLLCLSCINKSFCRAFKDLIVITLLKQQENAFLKLLLL